MASKEKLIAEYLCFDDELELGLELYLLEQVTPEDIDYFDLLDYLSLTREEAPNGLPYGDVDFEKMNDWLVKCWNKLTKEAE